MNHFAPIPCAHCGNNFMRRDLDPDAPKLCNNCILKDQIRHPKQEIKLEKVKLLIEVDRKTQIEIEELCTNEGFSISNYFIRLHEAVKMGFINNFSNIIPVHPNVNLDPEMQKMHDEFESMAHERETKNVSETKKKSKGVKK